MALKSCLCESHSPLRLMGPEVLFRDCPGLQFRLGIPVVLALGRLRKDPRRHDARPHCSLLFWGATIC